MALGKRIKELREIGVSEDGNALRLDNNFLSARLENEERLCEKIWKARWISECTIGRTIGFLRLSNAK